MTDILDFPLWSDDHIYPISIALNRSLSDPTRVTDQHAWYNAVENRVRLQIRRMCCEDTEYIEGIKVQRTENNRKQSFMVNNDRNTYGKECLKRYSFDEAVTRILELVAEREGCKICKT